AELDHTRSVLRRSGGKVTPAELTEARREIDAVAREVHKAAPPAPEPPGRPAAAGELRAGMEVWVSRLGGRAVVRAQPRNNKVEVQAGPLKVTVPLSEVRILSPGAKPAPQPSARARRGHNAFDEASSAATPGASVRGHYPSLKLVGERLDAAVALAEKFLDDALRSGQDGVMLIHGHGTGALRDGLRSHLQGFPGVTEVRPGSNDEGGDGVTVVVLG
ncbi:MAG TPA: Smr/MutS family protein, partial [Kofleriaceae bacterium]|nr:Smr/MutS family protein [Kofleriaceae bacterium]